MTKKKQSDTLWGNTIEQFILALHNVDVIWKPNKEGEQPPF